MTDLPDYARRTTPTADAARRYGARRCHAADAGELDGGHGEGSGIARMHGAGDTRTAATRARSRRASSSRHARIAASRRSAPRW